MSKSKGHIVVPETVPSILKTYVKDAIRTQPYDLLSWSAAYFRCISNNVPAPTKTRFEDNTEEMIESKCLTKEYLRALVKQIGHGYFVDRRVLQQRWIALSLPQDHLLALLSLCKMLTWERVHWLKLLSLLAASLSQDFPSTMDLLCELLTDNPVGGLNSVPFWIFSICYTFLAGFDCNLNDAENGYSENKAALKPAQINAQHFRKKLIGEWKACVKFADAQEISTSSISNDFDRIKQAMDFTQIIQALSEIPEIDTCNETNEDDNHDDLKKDNTNWKYEIIRRIGAPWNWIYQFVDHCSPAEKSYNFYECQHELFDHEYDERFDAANVHGLDVSGAGPIISTETVDTFLNYAKTKALENDGIISVKQIKEHENCPPMF